MKKNARFWVYINDSHAKLTLTPGQSIHHYRGERTDEGWRSETHVWTHEGSFIRQDWCSDGVDCDGRMTWSATGECALDRLGAHCGYAAPPGTPPMPDWQNIERSQRDYSAEAMGY